jgi:hypothetical protein
MKNIIEEKFDEKISPLISYLWRVCPNDEKLAEELRVNNTIKDFILEELVQQKQKIIKIGDEIKKEELKHSGYTRVEGAMYASNKSHNRAIKQYQDKIKEL